MAREPSLNNPFAEDSEQEFSVPGQVQTAPGVFEEVMKAGWSLQQRPRKAARLKAVERQHQKRRMTVWERMQILTDEEPTILMRVQYL